jgi:hypothetical protein
MKTNNQQERLKTSFWILGFTDGEGCFTISCINNSTTKFGKQIFPEFVISQSTKSLEALKEIQKFFGCGSIVLNKRYDNHREHMYKFCVRSISELDSEIIPFFDKFQLKTSKNNDFKIFRKIIKLMKLKKHFSEKGFNKILQLASEMNRKKKRL